MEYVNKFERISDLFVLERSSSETETGSTHIVAIKLSVLKVTVMGMLPVFYSFGMRLIGLIP